MRLESYKQGLVVFSPVVFAPLLIFSPFVLSAPVFVFTPFFPPSIG